MRCSLKINDMTVQKLPENTWSLCPVCLRKIRAERVHLGQKIILRKNCPEHGMYETTIWSGFQDMSEWIGTKEKPFEGVPPCPESCGLCGDHLRSTCCIIYNVTNRCNLNCSFCLAGDTIEHETSLEEICKSFFSFIEKGKTLLQLSGGEPTLRDDLPQIVQAAREAGARYVQLNSNGIRLGEDPAFVRSLAEAGLSFVFMQFDGTNDDIYNSIRGKKLLKIKQQAIENCAVCNIGVTLVPTLVRGINIGDIGNILRFAIAQSPKVRGVHFQPATYTGRIPSTPTASDRFTLDELIHEIQHQTEGTICADHLLPSACDHPLCGFHGDFIVNNNQIVSLLNRKNTNTASCCNDDASGKNREFVGRRWERPDPNKYESSCCSNNLSDMESFLKAARINGFTITAMAFQDAGNIDLARLRQCSLHVYDNGRTVPFCAYYLTAWKN